MATRANLSKEKQRLWIKLQRNYFEEGLVFQEFIPSEDEVDYWRIFLNLTTKSTEKGTAIGRGRKVSPEHINEQLNRCYSNGNLDVSEKFWLDIEKQVNFRGYFIPINEIAHLTEQSIKDNLEWGAKLNQHINIVGFLKAVKKAQKEYHDIDLPILGIWTYLKVYADALENIYTKGKEDLISNIWISDIIENKSDKSLPSSEVVQLLFGLVEHRYRLKDSLSLYQSRWTSFSHETREFYANNKEDIEELLLNNSQASNSSDFPILKDTFINQCKKDLRCLQVQEILDNHSGENMIEKMSDQFQKSFGPDRIRSIGERMRTAIGSISIIDRIKGFTDEGSSELLPNFCPAKEELIPEGAIKWSEHTDIELDQIQKYIQDDLTDSEYKRLKELSKKRCSLHFQNLSNIITAPIIKWIYKKGQLIPQFNILTDRRTDQYAEYYWQRQNLEDEDRALLTDLLKKIKELEYPSEVDRFASTAPSFNLYYIAEKWEAAWKDHMEALTNRLKYRTGKMKEFGILQSYESVDKRKDIWLDEILQIEEEVKPYIGFVKKAFAAALPIRQKVNFEPYRHNSDGVEFDPETIMDQNKWLRGDIMKSLQFETNIGKIEQVNSFCLDFSSSMNHERMRGLFKLLYLLVLGLEDRKTYDAIHFFGTSFISTSPFRNGYTDRSMLFNILRKIAQINKNGVQYRGLGGTNISEGVRMCHMEIENFNEHLIRQNPNVDIASSLFVLTDGEPTIGIVNNEELHDFIDDLRQRSNVVIKGIYLNPHKETSGFVQQIFGDDHYIECQTFRDTVNSFVSLMTKTYKQQRKDYRWEQKKRKIEGA